MEITPATRVSLGAIIVGKGFKITDDGVLTIDENYIEQNKYIEFTRERLDELFTASKLRRQ